MILYPLKDCTILEFLTDNEVELASSVDRVVETVAPVDTEQTDHRKEDSGADTGRPLDLERIEVLYVRPAVTALEECEHEYLGLRLENDRITELDSKLVIDVTCVRVAV